MKKIIYGLIILITCGSSGIKENNFSDSDSFKCTLAIEKNKLQMGDLPQLTVSIINNSGKDVYLIGALDGSEFNMRMPECRFVIQKPKVDTMPGLWLCANTNPLKEENFVKVYSGETFNPYDDVYAHGFFSSIQLTRKENFRNPGKYKIQFCYSTKSEGIKEFLGDGEANAAMKKMFDSVPKIELKSNWVEFEIKE